MKLKFYARQDKLCNARPGYTPEFGGRVKYVNREWDADLRAEVAVEKPFECEEGSPVGHDLLRKMTSRNGKKDPPLWPADEATAQRCGHPFVEVELANGEWIPKRKAEAPAKAEPQKIAKPKTATAAGKVED